MGIPNETEMENEALEAKRKREETEKSGKRRAKPTEVAEEGLRTASGPIPSMTAAAVGAGQAQARGQRRGNALFTHRTSSGAAGNLAAPFMLPTTRGMEEFRRRPGVR
jgi:hypothetical protein